MKIQKNKYQVRHRTDVCLKLLSSLGEPIGFPESEGPYCPALTDGYLCWPATKPGHNVSRPCPIVNGLDALKSVTRHCHISGRWDKNPNKLWNETSEVGYTPYHVCLTKTFEGVDTATLVEINRIGAINEKVEWTGLILSLVSLAASIAILLLSRRLRNFRNHLHVQLMIALLLSTVIRIVNKVIKKSELGGPSGSAENLTRNDSFYNNETSVAFDDVECIGRFVLLEYCKTCAYCWMILEGCYLHNALVVRVFSTAPRLTFYLIIGWTLPILHVLIWFLTLLFRDRVNQCLKNYFMMIEYIVMLDSVRLIALLVNLIFLLNIVRVVWNRVRESQEAQQADRKSIKAALMLIPLLGVPNILQVLPVYPHHIGHIMFAIYTYTATFFYHYQGLFVAILYCFTNKEVINAFRATYYQYRLTTASAASLRRGSRLPTQFGSEQNGFNALNTSQQPLHPKQAYSEGAQTQRLSDIIADDAYHIAKLRCASSQSPLVIDKGLKPGMKTGQGLTCNKCLPPAYSEISEVTTVHTTLNGKVDVTPCEVQGSEVEVSLENTQNGNLPISSDMSVVSAQNTEYTPRENWPLVDADQIEIDDTDEVENVNDHHL